MHTRLLKMQKQGQVKIRHSIGLINRLTLIHVPMLIRMQMLTHVPMLILIPILINTIITMPKTVSIMQTKTKIIINRTWIQMTRDITIQMTMTSKIIYKHKCLEEECLIIHFREIILTIIHFRGSDLGQEIINQKIIQ